ncbi:MAG TPA: nuclear transport factor 2 family protein [Dehalococcoidales bacterium]|nr:nuclear transport factor 2 family protein [Dehalococcoidales bacterium]
MNAQSLEKTVARLAAQVEALQKEVQNLKDIEAINRLQRAYGYYVEHMMGQEIIDCFSRSDGVYLQWIEGRYNGQTGLHRYFDRMRDNFSHELIHQVLQVSGIVTVAEDGLKAHGRWYAFGAVAVPVGDKVRENWENSIYEMEYVKEDGVWKMLGIKWNLNYWLDHATGLVKEGRRLTGPPPADAIKHTPDVFYDNDPRYPSGYIFPFHFPHPVTGKKTSEDKRNATINWAQHRLAWRKAKE